jgi:hypothetical protein
MTLVGLLQGVARVIGAARNADVVTFGGRVPPCTSAYTDGLPAG